MSSLIVFQNFTNYFLGSVYRIQNIVEEYSTYKVSKDVLLLKEGKIIALASADENIIQPKKVLLWKN